MHVCGWQTLGTLEHQYGKTVSDLCKFNHSACDSEENNPGSQQYSYISGRASPPRMGGRFIMTRTKVRGCPAKFFGCGEVLVLVVVWVVSKIFFVVFPPRNIGR